MTDPQDQAIKRVVLALAEEHRSGCNDPDCTISLALLGVLLDKAGIGVTEEEARKLW